MGDPGGTASRSPENKKERQDRGAYWLLLLLAALFTISLGVLISPVMAGSQPGMLPVDLGARSQADYSADLMGTLQAPLQLAIIGDVLRDHEPAAEDIGIRLTSIIDQLQTPLPTGEGEGVPSTPTAPASATASRTPTITATGTLPTATSSVSPTSTPNAGPTATPSSTQTATPTSPPPTATLVPATATPSPVPPTSTSTDPQCDQFSLTAFSRDGKIVTWNLNNGSGSSATITAIFINWPGGNSELVKIELAGDAIWDEGDTSPPTNITGGWKSGVSRTIGAGGSKELLFQYEEPAGASGYNLRVDLNNGCRVDN